MVGHKIRIAAIALTLTSLGASSAHGFCHGCNRWFGGTTAYRPYVAAYAPVATYAAPVAAPCAPCATACAPACPQTVSYMPQTCYRTVYVNTPVVAYQPVTSCDPCTRCPTTVMRPVTSYVMQARMMPYTSYRPVVTASYAPACPTPCASGCGTATPVTATYAPAPAPASCCNTSYSTPVVTSTPAVVQPAPIQAPASVVPSYPAQPSSPPASSAPGQTFQESERPLVPESRLTLPQSYNTYPRGVPRALDPETQDRTTAIPQRPWAATTVSTITPAVAIQPADSDWRAARN